MRGKDGDHALEAEDRAVDVRLFQDDAGVADAIARRKIVRAVDDDVVVLDQVQHVGAVHDGLVLDDLGVGVEITQALGGGLHFVLADAADPEEDLALKVGR